MKKVWILVIFVLVAIFGGRVWYLNKNKTDETNTVKIGVLSVLSGTYAFIGEEMNQGIQMAVEEFNSNHQLQMKTYIEDSKGISKDAINAFNKIVMHKNIKIEDKTVLFAPLT